MKFVRLTLILAASAFSAFSFQNCSDFSALSSSSRAVKTSMSRGSLFALGQSNRVGVDRAGDSPNFVDLRTGQIFIPRGPNFARLYNRPVHGPSYNERVMWAHGLFDVARYNPADIEGQLAQMQASGYNYVRVFVTGDDTERGFGLTAPGIGAGYLANVKDFLRRSKNHGLRVMLSAQYDWNYWTPANYHSIVDAAAVPPNTGGINSVILNPAVARAQGQFFADLLNGIKSSPGETLLDAVFAIDLWNELVASMVDCPFGTADVGLTYNFNGQGYFLGDAARRQALIDDATVNWINTAGALIKQADPSVLITASVLTAKSLGRPGFNGGMDFDRIAATSPLIAIRPRAIERSIADFIDIHIYNQNANFADFDQEMQMEEIDKSNPFAKPLVAGEIGVMLDQHPDQDEARTFFRNLIAKTAEYQFSGWGFWAWDNTGTSAAGGTGTYSMVQNNGAMNAEFAPIAVASYSRNWGVGPFISGKAINYSNGTEFCTYQNYEDWLVASSGGAVATPHVAIQVPLTYVGYCVVSR